MNNRLHIVTVFVQRQQKRRLFASAQRPGQRSLVVSSLFLGFFDRESILGVKERVPIEKVRRPVKLRRTSLRRDLIRARPGLENSAE